MRYPTKPNNKKYVKGYSFLPFAKKFKKNVKYSKKYLQNIGKYGKKLVDTAIKTGIDAAKTASKRVVQKSCRSNWRFDLK